MSFVTVPGLGEVSESTPFCSEAENHTMPHRETVASVAYCRLSTCLPAKSLAQSKALERGYQRMQPPAVMESRQEADAAGPHAKLPIQTGESAALPLARR